MKSTRRSQFTSLWLWILVIAGLFAGFYLMRTCPIRVRDEVVCPGCRGAGSSDCATCDGFGTVEKLEKCPKCKGTGKTALKFGNKPRSAPCTRCEGSGQVAGKRIECSACQGSQKGRCAQCGGAGRVSAPSGSRAVVMAYSPLERVRRQFKLPVEKNPGPQRGILGGYEIVRKYVGLRSSPQAAHVVAWGEFEQVGYPWLMTAEVEFRDKAGQPCIRHIEFTVQDRVLATSRVVQDPPR